MVNHTVPHGRGEDHEDTINTNAMNEMFHVNSAAAPQWGAHHERGGAGTGMAMSSGLFASDPDVSIEPLQQVGSSSGLPASFALRSPTISTPAYSDVASCPGYRPV
jgi:hypothetical protein